MAALARQRSREETGKREDEECVGTSQYGDECDERSRRAGTAKRRPSQADSKRDEMPRKEQPDSRECFLEEGLIADAVTESARAL